MNGNDLMSWVLRSPFHGMLSRGMMLITVTGRKTGKKYTTPVEYFQEDGYTWVLTSLNRTWWRNLRDGSQVELWIRRKPLHAFAELVLENHEIEKRLFDYLRHSPLSAKPMGVHMQGNLPDAGDVTRAAKDRLFVRMKLLD